ncbi:formate dehydrogenase subunit gamma [Oceanospirillum linum]|uniref:formate dehydrogenase subunit gamma n=1 Tax=Oceanospirillum linum TaxID=966 RepID=UPI00089E2BC6|nr:formate dehydrogenase subunit gamma [Oceanospirillum linum]SEG14970.1 formate dehydrogenase gamma subunit [Oleiphilus messinensis]SMP11004.1 formate dehydrogenase gamma subunit [Oceanospirillum linum]
MNTNTTHTGFTLNGEHSGRSTPVQRLKIVALSLLTLLCLTLSSSLWAAEETSDAENRVKGNFAGAGYWREVSDGTEGYTTSKGREHGQLINVSGETWRQWRNRWISPGGLIAIGGSISVLLLTYLILGPMRLDKPRTGRKIERWNPTDRTLHWFVAITFLALAFSGIIIMYGKHFIPDLFGYSFWKGTIAFCKLVHNYIGPIFSVGLIVMLLRWLKNNFFTRTDITWFLQGGGLIGNKHPSAGFMNGGEKGWYWALFFIGSAVVASGFVLDFPIFGQVRDTMQWANLIHGGASLLLFAISLGHIYIGTVGAEGALEGMTTGYVDETWAKQHHDLWYEDVKDQAVDEKDVR